MSTRYPQDTRTRRSAAPPPPPPAQGGGLDLATLVIASIAAVVAALVVSHFWGAGTIVATALTPVIVALVKEGLSRPAARITEVSARGSSTAARVLGAQQSADGPTIVAEEFEPGEHEAGEYRVYGRPHGGGGHKWKIALATGGLAFVVAVAAITLPELVAGRSIVHSSRGTTLLGGHSSHKSSSKSSTSSTSTVTTVTETTPSTSTPTVTQTVPSPTTSTPTTSTPPAQTTPVPQTAPVTPPAATTPAP